MTHDFRQRYGPVALVTGASSGIGRAFAEELATYGINLILVARRIDRLEILAERLEGRNGIGVMPLEVDLADPSAATRILDATASLDIGLIVSSAGFGIDGRFEDGDPARLTDMLTVNCQAAMMLAHGYVPRLRARSDAGGGRGGILFTSAMQGMIGSPYAAAYSATQTFLSTLGEALWAELAPGGIDVLTLCPGATDGEATGMQRLDPAPAADRLTPNEVARLALENLGNGPTYNPHRAGQGSGQAPSGHIATAGHRDTGMNRFSAETG